MWKTPNRSIVKFSSGGLASVLIHGLLLSVIIFGLPQAKLEVETPQAIQVELVPPAKKAEPTPPPKPKAVAEAKPKPAVKPEPKEIEQAKAEPPKTLQPVFKFGEKDQEANDPKNDSADRDAKTANEPPVKKAEKQPQELKPEPKIEKPTELKPELLTPKLEQALPKPELAAVEPSPEAIALASINPAKPNFRPKKRIRKRDTKSKKTRKTRSQPNKKRTAATTAKGDLSRGLRAGRLCVTELRSQMNNAIPPHWPDRLPTYRLSDGNVLQVRRGAFREKSRWINLKFRCEVNNTATEVVAFQMEIGAPVPRSQWRKRGLPGS